MMQVETLRPLNMRKFIPLLICFLYLPVFAVSPAITSFNTGQVSPLIEERTDYEKYNSACRTLENFLVTSQGPVIRRPGTKYIASVKDSNYPVRLIPFEYSTEDTYMLELGDKYIRFYRNGGQILTSLGTEDLGALDSNNIAYWKLNNNADSNEVSEEKATYTGYATTTTDVLHYLGKIGSGSFDLDGKYAVEIADTDVLSFVETANPFSIAGWIYTTDSAEIQTIVSKWNAGTAREYRLYLDSDEKLKFELFDEDLGLDTNSVSQWKLNDNAASTVVVDSMSLQNGVSTTNTSGLHAIGKLDGAFDFDNQYAVEVADNTAYTFSTGDTTDKPFSVAAWVYNNGSDSIQGIIGKTGSVAVGDKFEWLLYLNSQKIYFQLFDNSLSIYRMAWTSSSISTGWHFVVATYDGRGGDTANAGMILYVDEKVADVTLYGKFTYVAMHNLTGNVTIGAYYSGNVFTGFWKDKIDNVMIFNKELTLAEVLSLYASGSGTEDLAGDSPYIITDDALSVGWHFIAATYDSNGGNNATDGMTLYVDSNIPADACKHDYASYTAMVNTSSKFRIGSQLSILSGQQYIWQDKIDNVMLFNKELSSSDISLLYSTGPYETDTPYLQSEISSVQYAQSDNKLYIVHPNHPPQKLERYAHDWWLMDDVNIITGPFLLENTENINITPSDVNGSITLTANSPIFRSDHVGSLWQITQERSTSLLTGTFSGDGVSASSPYFYGSYGFTTKGSSWAGTITLERSTNNGTTWKTALDSLHDVDVDNPSEREESGAIYRVRASDFSAGSTVYNFVIADPWNNGVVRIVGYTSPTVVTATVIRDLASTTATNRWREGYWSDYRGWPQTIEFCQQRLVFGGSTRYPQTIWFGKANPDDYENFLEGTLDTSAFTITLQGQNPIRWLLSQDYLFIGTSGSAGKYGEQGQTITPTSPNYREQSKSGSASIRAVLAGDAVLYVERGGRKIREFIYNLQMEKFLSPDLTILSEDITASGIKDVAFQTRPNPVLWCVRNDGNVATLTYQREQEIYGWSLQITDGNYESIAKIPTESGEDEIWVEVERTIDGNNYRYIEQFQPVDWGDDANDCWFVDSGLSRSGSATNTFSGLGHLEGKTVSVYADGIVCSDEVVSGGSVTIDNSAEKVIIGLPYTSKLETLPFVLDTQVGSTMAMSKKVSDVDFDFYETGYAQYGSHTSELSAINFFPTSFITAKQSLYTSINASKNVKFPFGLEKKQTIKVETNKPLPLCIRAIIANYSVNP
jgi:hypothetical protein